MKRILIWSSITMLLLSACKKDQLTVYNPNVKAELSVEFDNIVGSSDLKLNTETYTNASGELFSISKLKYFVSNFKLIKTDGTEYIVPQQDCYFLIDENDESTHEPVLNVPEGEYKSISFMVGIDNPKNCQDPRTSNGMLDTATTAADMYWNNSQGYIFFNMEGSSAFATSGDFKYHIGGSGAILSPAINNLKTITLDLTGRGTPKVKAGKETNIHLMVDVLKIFTGASNVSLAVNAVVMFDPFSAVIANNYATIFHHDHTEN